LPGRRITDEFASRERDLQAIVAAVDDDDVAVLFDGNASGRSNSPSALALHPIFDEFPAAVEHRDRMVHSSEQ